LSLFFGANASDSLLALDVVKVEAALTHGEILALIVTAGSLGP
jgi:hypothetical protein